ncbi:DUF1641 domain-containing protein [Sulfodiicoccus acidiphilus]|nr:DUF1641 domain-containing protein [Sulfodiicoccus acidiphilus]
MNQKGVLSFLEAFVERWDDVLAVAADWVATSKVPSNALLLYEGLNKAEIDGSTPTLSQILRELNDPAVRRGLMFFLSFLKAIGSAAEHKEGKSPQTGGH